MLLGKMLIKKRNKLLYLLFFILIVLAIKVLASTFPLSQIYMADTDNDGVVDFSQEASKVNFTRIYDSIGCENGVLIGINETGPKCKYVAANVRYCGDGIKQGGEECDDSNNVDGDGCSAICEEEVCGDYVVNNVDEVCDTDELNGGTCQTEGFDYGTLSCNSDCLTYDTSLCLNYGTWVQVSRDDVQCPSNVPSGSCNEGEDCEKQGARGSIKWYECNSQGQWYETNNAFTYANDPPSGICMIGSVWVDQGPLGSATYYKCI